MRKRFWTRLRRIGGVPAADIELAKESTQLSTLRAREDLKQQEELLRHERRTITGPLRDERVKVNHLAVLAQQALRGN